MKKFRESYFNQYGISLSDIDFVFSQAKDIENDSEKVDFVFDNLSELPDNLIIELWDSYLEEEMQTSSNTGINNSIGFNKIPPYNTELINLY
jgi:hypothetical protein